MHLTTLVAGVVSSAFRWDRCKRSHLCKPVTTKLVSTLPSESDCNNQKLLRVELRRFDTGLLSGKVTEASLRILHFFRDVCRFGASELAFLLDQKTLLEHGEIRASDRWVGVKAIFSMIDASWSVQRGPHTE